MSQIETAPFVADVAKMLISICDHAIAFEENVKLRLLLLLCCCRRLCTSLNPSFSMLSTFNTEIN
jgi:hypothetical protein